MRCIQSVARGFELTVWTLPIRQGWFTTSSTGVSTEQVEDKVLYKYI